MLKEQRFYENSKGIMVDPKDMATQHVESALAKAKRENHEENMQVLEEELSRRNASSPSIEE